jgi:16S rRNA (guanine527-N7)-methyltransferase
MLQTKLLEGAAALGLNLNSFDFDALERFYALLLDWNSRHNLMRIAAPEDFIEKHVLDSLLLAPLLPPQGLILDIGSGPGFPGIPLALYSKIWTLILIESQQKKGAFLKEAVATLGLAHVAVWNDYLSKKNILSVIATGGDIANAPVTCVSRAVTSPEELIEMCLPAPP